jgi:hypothetical protein
VAETDGELTFVVAGEPPSALAVAADRVREIVPCGVFSGIALDLRPLLPDVPLEDDTHVLVVRREPGDVGLCVRGRLKMLTLAANAVLPLPAVVGQRAGLSHLIAPRGVPLMFVLDLTRLDDAETGACPWQAGAVATET